MIVRADLTDADLPIPQPPHPAPSTVSNAWSRGVTFTSLIPLASRYHGRLFNQHRHSSSVMDRASELSWLVVRADFVLKSAHVLHAHLWRIKRLETPSEEEHESAEYTRFVLDIYTETFYYFGHRLQKLMTGARGEMPYISGYREAIGVREVRNKFLEHPPREIDNMAKLPSYNVQFGPAISRGRLSSDRSSAKSGLFADAVELKSNLGHALQAAHRRLDEEGPDSTVEIKR